MNRERYLQEIDAVNAAGKYHPTWELLSTHPVPDWYREKRLGIFLHWGAFSVPAYHDWYARNMYIKGSPEYEYHCPSITGSRRISASRISFRNSRWKRSIRRRG